MLRGNPGAETTTSVRGSDDASGSAERSIPPMTFEARFATLFDQHFAAIFRLLDRLTGEPDVAADLAQETFVRLYRRGAPPDAPDRWLVSVALNLFRNHAGSRRRRGRLLTVVRAEGVHADAAPAPDAALLAEETRERVRHALDQLPARERSLLLLRAEGYSYRDCASALQLNEASVGVLLARAKRAFRDRYEEPNAAP